MLRFSIGYVAVCEFLLGAIFVTYFGIDCVLILRPYGRTHVHEVVISMLFVGMLTAFCFASGISLLRGLRWSWFAGWVLGLLVLALGVASIYDAFNPSSKNPDGYFGIIYGPPLILISAVGLVLLNLPQTRRFVLHAAGDLYSQ